jgi:hypothetical protein
VHTPHQISIKKFSCVLTHQNDCISKSEFFLQKNVFNLTHQIFNAPKFNKKNPKTQQSDFFGAF